jgi:hypothetical protein
VCRVDGLAKCLVGPAGVVSDDTDGFGDIVLESFLVRFAYVDARG